MTVFYSVIIPAYNEEEWLPKILAALGEAMDALDMPGEVIVVDNNSTDRTAQTARKHGARVVFEPVNQISRARNAGARIAKGRYLIFLDADTILPPDLLRAVLGNLSSGTCCGGGAVVAFEKSLRPLVRKGKDLWNWISVKFGMAAGCFIYCLREGFEGVGGFTETVYASEEIWFSRQLRSWGNDRGMAFRVIVDPPVVTSSRKFDWFSPLQLTIMLLVMAVCPFAIRFRPLCLFWYSRPQKKEQEGRGRC